VPRIGTKKRYFEQVVADLRQAVFAVIRHRPNPSGGGRISFPLGSGFFISPTLFLTCHHVINATEAPHQNGDEYHLVHNLGNQLGVFAVGGVTVGNQLHLFADADLALLNVNPSRPDQPYVALDFGGVPEGLEIGVAGYPLPNLLVTPAGELRYDGVIYRVAKGVVTATYPTQITAPALPGPINAAILEVNFLFVSGNSGGPIFRADNGTVVGFVHGFRAHTVAEKVQEVTLIPALPAGVSNSYIQNVHALYSIGIKLDATRTHLQGFGISV
jgi:hypothetical protein